MITNVSGAISFLCPSALSISYNYRSLNEGIFNHRIEKNITLNGLIDGSPTGLGGYYNLWQDISEIKPCGHEFYEIKVNNFSLGQGRIISFTFPGGPDVIDKEYSAEIQFVETGSLFGMSGQYYSGLTLNPNWAKQLLSFQGDSSFAKNTNNSYTYNKSLSIQTESGSTYTPRQVAENVSQAFFNQNVNLSSLSGIFPDLQFSQANKRRQESINSISNTYSFSEEYTITSGNPWRWNYDQSYALGPNGVSTVTEKGQIEGSKSPAYTYALQGLNQALSSADVRVDNFYSNYVTGICSRDLLLQGKSVRSDRNVGVIDYSLDFTDDIEFANTGVVYSYGSDLNVGVDGLAIISLNGRIQGLGGSSSEKISKATNFWGNISGGLQSEAQDIYNDYTGDLGINTNRSPRPTNKTFSYSRYNGRVSYDWRFSDDPYLIDHTGFVRAEASQEYNSVTPMVNLFSVPNYQEFFQPTIQGNLGSISNRVEIIGKEGSILTGYLSQATGHLLGVPTGSVDPFVQSLGYNFNPLQKRLSLDITWNYFKSGGINNNLNFNL